MPLRKFYLLTAVKFVKIQIIDREVFDFLNEYLENLL